MPERPLSHPTPNNPLFIPSRTCNSSCPTGSRCNRYLCSSVAGCSQVPPIPLHPTYCKHASCYLPDTSLAIETQTDLYNCWSPARCITTPDGYNVIMADCDGSAEQDWKFDPQVCPRTPALCFTWMDRRRQTVAGGVCGMLLCLVQYILWLP